MADTEDTLARLRGTAAPKPHTARTIAALTANPGCHRRAVLDAAGVDKQRVAARAGFPAPAGQSQFAITRGNSFEAQVKANGGAELLRLLRELLDLPLAEVGYLDLGQGDDRMAARHARTRDAMAAALGPGPGTLYDHPVLRLDIAGRPAYLEPDLVAFRAAGQFHVVEIKSFAVIDGRADGGKVAAAVTQAAVYVLALRALLADLGLGPENVADTVVLVCPENFANRPTAVRVDVRKQLTVLRRQLSRLERVDELVAGLPVGLTFDDPADAAAALRAIGHRYVPECLDACELAYFCRNDSRDDTATLGRSVRDELGGLDSVTEALAVADGVVEPGTVGGAGGADRLGTEAGQMLRTAARLRREILGEAR